MLNNMYPKCGNSFKQWCTSHPKWELFYKYLGNPKPFDVTLRDGLQGLSLSQQNEFTLEQKKELYHSIIRHHNPEFMEVGSIVSEKLLPIFKDSIDFHKYVEKQQRLENKKKSIEFCLLVPNQGQLKKVVNNYLINNFSFITSMSNSFHFKNTKMTLEEGDKDIDNMITLLDINTERYKNAKIKLYISCVNYCPFEGLIDNDFIVHRLLQLNRKKVDILCLSDTCGTLTCDDFEYIVDTCFYFGIPYSKFALHLHINYGKEIEVEKIIHKALDRKIINFDVSLLDSGGCSITITKDKLLPNLSYDLYYKSLVNYIKRKT
uniref:Pyruvate carboxyltransferase domain-containing protein n=1 Tax=viral metagenome TaxID=1070528 RepID=A0A6C0IEI2_9ZZZZ